MSRLAHAKSDGCEFPDVCCLEPSQGIKEKVEMMCSWPCIGWACQNDCSRRRYNREVKCVPKRLWVLTTFHVEWPYQMFAQAWAPCLYLRDETGAEDRSPRV